MITETCMVCKKGINEVALRRIRMSMTTYAYVCNDDFEQVTANPKPLDSINAERNRVS